MCLHGGGARSLIADGLTIALGTIFVLVSWLLATDPLTGLSNRRVRDSRLDAEWAQARRNDSLMSVLFVDIDHFKRFNDTYGHAAGDEVLAAFAECIGSVVRRSVDLVVWYGGEEFAVVLPDTPEDGALGVAEKIRRKVQDMKLVHEHSDYGTVTVSIGCAATLPVIGGNALELLAQADAQLYAAKAGGRNRVKLAVQAEASAPATGTESMHDVHPVRRPCRSGAVSRPACCDGLLRLQATE